MANKTGKGTFTSENQPDKSGSQWFRTKLIDSLKRQAMTEEAFIDLLVTKAITDGGVYLTELLKRYSPLPKQTYEKIVIENWPKDGTALEKANAILNAMSQGLMPPDLGALFMSSIKDSLGIEELTELSKRLEALEVIINANK